MLAALRRTGRPRGQALTEFALILPAMIIVLLVAVDFGRVFFTYIQVNNAAREAAYAASVDPTDVGAIQARAAAEVNVQGQGGEGSLTVDAPTCATAATPPVVTACPSAGFTSPPGPGIQVTVAVSRSFRFLTPIIGDLFGSFALGASATAPLVPQAASVGGGGGGGVSPPGPCVPVADFTFDQGNAANRKVEFDPSDSAPGYTSCPSNYITLYAWDWNGDGKVDDTQVPDKKVPHAISTITHQFPNQGTQYTVTLTITTLGGGMATFSQPVLTLTK